MVNPCLKYYYCIEKYTNGNCYNEFLKYFGNNRRRFVKLGIPEIEKN